MMADGSLLVSLGFALLFTVPGTFSAWLMTWLIARLPAADRLPLPLLLLMGFAVSLLVFRPYNRFIYELIQVTSPQIARMAGDESLRDTAEHFLLINVPGALIWTALNLLFIAKTGFPVYGASKNAEIEDDRMGIAPVVVLPDFCRTSGLVALSDLWAISAEEHYLRLHGPFGNRMIRHSFGAALEQMPVGQGLQVHRSHWVAFGRVAAIESGSSMQLRLADGTHIPVSSSYRRAALLKEAELLGT